MSSITLKKIIISKVEAQLKDFQSKNLISWAGNIIKRWFKNRLLLNLEISIYSLSRIDADNNYNNLFIVNPIENPEIPNSYSKKLFAGAVDSFSIMRNRIFSKFFNGFDDSLAVFGIQFLRKFFAGVSRKISNILDSQFFLELRKGSQFFFFLVLIAFIYELSFLISEYTVYVYHMLSYVCQLFFDRIEFLLWCFFS